MQRKAWKLAKPVALAIGDKLGALYTGSRVRVPIPATSALRVLVVGVYLADRVNTVEHLVGRFQESGYAVTQQWIALNGPPPSEAVSQVTVDRRHGYVPKFTLVNALLRSIDLRNYEYVVFVDDDISVPAGFMDAYIGYQRLFGFALAQPARTVWSRSSYHFVRQRPHLLGRRTSFVEIGPVFSVSRSAQALLLPFDESSPMGWGYDLHWPVVLREAGLSMGIVDAVPVNHVIRGQSAAYSGSKEVIARDAYLSTHAHLLLAEALTTSHRYRRGHGSPAPMGVSA